MKIKVINLILWTNIIYCKVKEPGTKLLINYKK